MTSPSNLYAEKVYAEQPTSLWSLDDDCTFVSFLPTSQLDFSFPWTGWDGYNPDTNPTGTMEVLSDSQSPFPPIAGENFVSINISDDVVLTSPSEISATGTFGAGIWINPSVIGRVSSVKFTYGTEEKTFDISDYGDKWMHLEHIFKISSSQSHYFVITITYGVGVPAGDIFLNGFSIGQNQEFFGTESVGNDLVATGISGLYGVKAYEYGLGQNNGWYIGDNSAKVLYAKNFSTPLVFGANTSTVLYENPDGPSLILPGRGFLSKDGSNNTLCFEAWLRIKTDGVNQSSPFRIIGPLNSNDGIYVNGQHMILKVGDQASSHYIREWFRPMLVDIEYTSTKVSLFVNGEDVCSLDIDSPELSDQNDFIGFFAGGNVEFVEVDCVAVYPYRVSPVLLKRRFGYGQAVQIPSEIETGYSGKQLAVDYTFAGYSFDYSYPNIESWSSSIKDGIYVDKTIMGSPPYVLPDIVISGTDLTEKDWMLDNSESSIKMLPAERWSNANVYMYLDKIRQPRMSAVSSIFLTGQADGAYSDRDQVLLRIQNKATLDSISIVLSNDKIYYSYNVFGTQGILDTKTLASSSSTFAVGLDINALINNELISSEVRRFLKGISRYQLFIAGDYSGADESISTIFMGTLSKFGISSKNNYEKENISGLFTNGIANVTSKTSFDLKNPTYGMHVLAESFGTDTLSSITTSSTSYWQDYIPLLKFAKATLDGSYVSDMVQISIDYAASSALSSGKIDTSNTDVKAYVYFVQDSDITKISSFGENQDLGLTPVAIDQTLVVDATSWQSKMFEVVDGAVIILPTANQASLSMVTFIEIKSKSSDKYPIKIRSLEYAAQTFSRGQSTSSLNKSYAKQINGRSATTSMYMFKEDPLLETFVYSGYNPVSISKNSTPYLYLTNKTGIKVLDSYSTEPHRGLLIPVNELRADATIVSLISLSTLYNDKEFPADMSVIEMYPSVSTSYGGNRLRLALQKFSNDATRANVYVQKETAEYSNIWETLNNVKIYINGHYLSEPTICAGEWATIAIYFASDSIDFSNNESKIEITGSCLVNNLSYYQQRPEELEQQLILNAWNDIEGLLWENIDTEKTWVEVYAIKSYVEPSLTPDIISNIYYGTNKVLSVGSDDSTGIKSSNYKYDVINDIVWQQSVTVSP